MPPPTLPPGAGSSSVKPARGVRAARRWRLRRGGCPSEPRACSRCPTGMLRRLRTGMPWHAARPSGGTGGIRALTFPAGPGGGRLHAAARTGGAAGAQRSAGPLRRGRDSGRRQRPLVAGDLRDGCAGPGGRVRCGARRPGSRAGAASVAGRGGQQDSLSQAAWLWPLWSAADLVTLTSYADLAARIGCGHPIRVRAAGAPGPTGCTGVPAAGGSVSGRRARRRRRRA